jgi:NADH-quinone oxidoreductase subunit F
MKPGEVVEQIAKSGLRGRGGAGFPTGVKWRIAAAAKGDVKYIVCNADEGDPGAFMDRSVLESDPHAVIEGMIIGAYAIGAREGYIYCRAEYPLAVHRLHLAISQAAERNLLGKNILGTPLSLDIHVKEGAGAFVCGEETALMASIEGDRGMPRLRPPFPAERGIWGKPTNINNVETFANVPRIILKGADWYASLGTEKSKGTKVFALAGKIRRGGLIEVPMGITLKEIVFDIGGGIKAGKEFKAVQMGGPSGGCIPRELVDTIIDYDSVTRTGAIMGSGGMVVVDEDTCMVEIARYFLEFTQKESCGKCTFCRVGTKRMLEILERITKGEGVASDLDTLQKLAVNVKMGSLCGLGQTAPNPVLTTLRYFRHEYEAHIKEKKCPAKQCRGLISFRILDSACTGCGVCAKLCPVKAIAGERKQVHVIDQKACIRCGLCYDSCKFGAITVE